MMLPLFVGILLVQPVTTEQDYRETLRMLGIDQVRIGAEGMDFSKPNAANRDEANAEPYGNYPDPLTFADGRLVRTTQDWTRRRKELMELFDREIYGRQPKRLPKVTWTLVSTSPVTIGTQRAIRKTLRGVVDNRSFPALTVEIPVTIDLPASAQGPVPVILEFGFRPPSDAAGSWAELCLARGYGAAVIVPTGYQADHGAGLRAGIIGLVNRGKLRKRDDWGALRAWAWGVSQTLDYFETDPAVDAKRVAIEGLSRYGKAALVAMAVEPRLAAAFVGSSGAGGAKLWRRNFGELESNVASSGEYHWMTPNFIRYAGPLTPRDMPIDQHELIALCAPRPVFIGCGSPNVEGIWVDDTGMFKATEMASRVYDLLGVRGITGAKMPPENEGLTDQELAFRQHSGGHTNGPNWPAFLDWFTRCCGPIQGVPRSDANSAKAHAKLLAKTHQGKIDLYMLGDSIMRRWGCADPVWAPLLANWNENFHGWNAADFGWGADSTLNILWRIENGELDGVHPKAIVLLAGTNDLSAGAKPLEIARRIGRILDVCQTKVPRVAIVLTAIFPRNDRPDLWPTIVETNRRLARLADGKRVRFLSVNDRLADANGVLREGMMQPDHLHPAVGGYQVWADGLRPILTALLGPRAKKDSAPPPSIDPSLEK